MIGFANKILKAGLQWVVLRGCEYAAAAVLICVLVLLQRNAPGSIIFDAITWALIPGGILALSFYGATSYLAVSFIAWMILALLVGYRRHLAGILNAAVLVAYGIAGLLNLGALPFYDEQVISDRSLPYEHVWIAVSVLNYFWVGTFRKAVSEA